MKLTGATLLKLFPTLNPKKAERFAPHYAAALELGEITTRARLCAFVAQEGHESSDLKHLREIWGPTPAQARYDVRTDLGNTPERDGDGEKYMGRGGLQRTGKANYLRFQEATGVPVVDRPELLEQPEHAFASDALYWKDKKLNRLADRLTLRGDAKDLANFDKITRTINGGYNHRVERQRRYLVAIATLPENFFQLEETPAEKSALDRVNDHVNATAQTVHPLPDSSSSNGSEKDATAKILIAKLGKKEGTKAVARSLGRRLAEPAALLIAALSAGNVFAWIATVAVIAVIVIVLYRERHAIARKLQSLKQTIAELL